MPLEWAPITNPSVLFILYVSSYVQLQIHKILDKIASQRLSLNMGLSKLALPRKVARILTNFIGRPTIIRAQIRAREPLVEYFLEKTGCEGSPVKEIEGGSNESSQCLPQLLEPTSVKADRNVMLLVTFAERLVNRTHEISTCVGLSYNMGFDDPDDDLYKLLVGDTFRGIFSRAYTTDGSNKSEGERDHIIGGARMTNKEADIFIKCMDVIRDAKDTPSKRRYFRSDGSIIAEAKWVTESEIKEAKSPILAMAEAEAIEIEQEKRDRESKIGGSASE